MRPFVSSLEKVTLENTHFRHVLYTGKFHVGRFELGYRASADEVGVDDHLRHALGDFIGNFSVRSLEVYEWNCVATCYRGLSEFAHSNAYYPVR